MNLVPGATPSQFQNAEIDTPGAFAAHVGQRHAAQQQHDAHRRRRVGQRLAAAPRRLRPAGGDDRDGQHLDQQLRRRPRHGRRRGVHGHHQVRHEPAAAVRPSCSTTTSPSTPTPCSTTRSAIDEAAADSKTSTAAPSAGRSCATGCSTSGRGSAYRIRRGRHPDSAYRRAKMRAVTSARWRRPTRRSGSSTRSTGDALAPIAASSRQHDPEPDRSSPIAAACMKLLPAAQQRQADLNSNQLARRLLDQIRENTSRSRQLRHQVHWQRSRRALGLGQVLGAERRRIGRQLPAGLRQPGEGRHAGLRGDRRAHLDAEPEPSVVWTATSA